MTPREAAEKAFNEAEGQWLRLGPIHGPDRLKAALDAYEAAEIEAHRRSVRAYEDEARAWLAEGGPLYAADNDVKALATLLSRVDRSATERAAGIADKIAGDPPSTPSGRHDDWQIGHQDGAMECAAAIRRAAAEQGDGR